MGNRCLTERRQAITLDCMRHIEDQKEHNVSKNGEKERNRRSFKDVGS